MLASRDIPVDAILIAAERSEIIAALEALYADLEAEITLLGPTCWNHGDCCRFGAYGHRLYVTTLEAGYYMARRGQSTVREEPETPATCLPVLPTSEPPFDHDTCPHAYGGRCNVRGARPLGCRIFYCDPAAQHWQAPLTERYLDRLRALHDALGVPYAYADWMTVLGALTADGT